MSIIDPSEILLELGLSDSVTDEERALVNTAIVRAEGAVKRILGYDPVQRSRTEFYPRQDYDQQANAAVWEAEGTQAVLRRVAEAATSELQVQHIPIRSITNLYVDYDGRSGTSSGAFAAASEKTEGTDFWPNYDGEDSDGESLCKDGIIRSIGRWPTTPGTIKLVYVAGYSAKEIHGQDTIVDASPIMDATIDEAVRRAKGALIWKKKTGGGHVAGPFTSERLGDYSYTADSSLISRMFGGLYDVLPGTKMKLESFVNWGWAL